MRKHYKLSDLEKAREEGSEDSAWLITLSDMMMLLLTFFVMLFIIIEPSDQDYVGALRKIGDALGGKSLADRKMDLSTLQLKIDGLIKDNNLVKHMEATTDERGTVLLAEGDLFFKPGTAELTGDVKLFLKHVGRLIKETQYKVLVEGHTDDTPIKSPLYPSNWELSTARAASVVRYFTETMDINPRRFTAAGRAHFKPRYALIPENRPKNRRVEIIILREKL